MDKSINIAVVTITMNDDYKIKEWRQWFREYREDIGTFIIVDNNSSSEYRELLKETFPEAFIIELGFNGGCTSAYNAGIKKALEDPSISHIALVGNDIRIEPLSLVKCAQILNRDETLGMVAPVLLNADSNIVADYGCSINSDLSMNPYGVGMNVKDLTPDLRYCEAVTGGMNISKRSFYETTVGLQDENLFMYSDEVDMGLRAKKAGVKMAVTKEALSWHQHINPPGIKRRHPFSNYLIARNKVYLGKKHLGPGRQIFIFNNFFFVNLLILIKNFITGKWNQLIYPRWSMIGAINGLVGNMKETKYSKL